MSSFKHIIWDWNGTLWNDAWLCVEINNHMLERRKLPLIDLSVYQDKLCFPVNEYYCQLGFDYDKESYNALAEEFIREYTERRYECDLQHDARKLIEDLHEKGFPQAVLSAYQHDTLVEAVGYFKLETFFDDIIGLNDIYASGKVENGLKYIAGLDLAPSEVLFVGDTLHDFEVAEAMGVECVLISHGHNSRMRLITSGVLVLDSLAGVRQFIDP
jgi:phosphoglycolate phosphatase